MSHVNVYILMEGTSSALHQHHHQHYLKLIFEIQGCANACLKITVILFGIQSITFCPIQAVCAQFTFGFPTEAAWDERKSGESKRRTAKL